MDGLRAKIGRAKHRFAHWGTCELITAETAASAPIGGSVRHMLGTDGAAYSASRIYSRTDDPAH